VNIDRPRLIDRVKHFYARLSAGDRLGDAFYAVWMPGVSIGLINAGQQITPPDVVNVVVICLGVNAVWGVIDGVTVMYSTVIERAKNDRIVWDLRSGERSGTVSAHNHLDGTIFSALPPVGQAKILAILADGELPPDPVKNRYGPRRDDWLIALAIVGLDIGLALPIVVPLLLVSDIHMAVYISRLVATIAFAAIGWGYAKNLNRQPWLAMLGLGALGFAVFTAAYEAGW